MKLKLKISKALILPMASSILLFGCSSRTDEQIDAGIRMAQQTPKVPVKETETLSARGHEILVKPPAGYVLQKMPCPGGTSFLFSGPKTGDQKATVLSLILVGPPGQETLPEVSVILDAILKPFRVHLSDYSENPRTESLVSGHKFTGFDFQGKYGFVYPTKGFVVATSLGDSFLVVQGQYPPQSTADASLLSKSFLSIKIQK